jgi:hypothetical protein
LTNKYIGMKKKIIFAVSFILIAWSVTSCDVLLKKCEFCKIVVRDTGGSIVSSGTETEYCGADLTVIKNTTPAPVGGQVAKYECR